MLEYRPLLEVRLSCNTSISLEALTYTLNLFLLDLSVLCIYYL
jgi:hypothetical protein